MSKEGLIMRLLNDEEILKSMQEAHPEGEECPMWAELGERLKREVQAVTKSQHQLDLKKFVEDLEYHGEADNEPWKTAESFILPMWYLRDLKQLVEEK